MKRRSSCLHIFYVAKTLSQWIRLDWNATLQTCCNTIARACIVKGALLYGSRDVPCDERVEPRIEKPTEAILKISATCICGSDLWPYRGISQSGAPTPMGHEYCGIVEEIGSEVKTIRKDQFVVGSFFALDNTCPICRAGYQTSCIHREQISTAQAPYLRVPLADGTLVGTAGVPSSELLLLDQVSANLWSVLASVSVRW